MQVQFTNTNKRENSTAIPASFSATRSCVLKNASSIINPVIELDRTVNEHTYNYCYIADFSRYYWVRDIIYEDARIIYYLDCDVLASARTFIGNASMYVLRAYADYNGEIQDTLYPTNAIITRDKNTINNFWDTESTVDADGLYTGGSYIVGIASENGVTHYIMTYAHVKLLINYLLSILFAQDVMGVFAPAIALYPRLHIDVDPLQYITTFKWLPFIPLTGNMTLKQDIPIANVTTGTGCSGYVMSTPPIQSFTFNFTNIKNHPQIARGEYLNGAPYTETTLDIAPFGIINIDPLQIANSDSIGGLIQVDTRTGSATLSIIATKNNSGEVISKLSAQLGIDVPLSQVFNTSPSVSGVISAVNDISTHALQADKVGALGAGFAAIGDIAKSIIPTANVIGACGGIDALRGNIRLNYTWRHVVDDDNTQRGRPLCEVRQLSTLAGYQLIADADIRTTLTAEEDRKIKQYLESGYFYE